MTVLCDCVQSAAASPDGDMQMVSVGVGMSSSRERKKEGESPEKNTRALELPRDSHGPSREEGTAESRAEGEGAGEERIEKEERKKKRGSEKRGSEKRGSEKRGSQKGGSKRGSKRSPPDEVRFGLWLLVGSCVLTLYLLLAGGWRRGSATALRSSWR